mgnify:FL=1
MHKSLYSAGMNKFLLHGFIGIVLELMCRFLWKGLVVRVIGPQLGSVPGQALPYII